MFVFIFFRVNSSQNPFNPLKTLSLIVISPPVSTTIGESYCVKKKPLVLVRYQVESSYGADVFPTVRSGLVLYEIVFFIISIFAFIIINNSFLFRGSYLNSLIEFEGFNVSGEVVTVTDVTPFCVPRRVFEVEEEEKVGRFASLLGGGNDHPS